MFVVSLRVLKNVSTGPVGHGKALYEATSFATAFGSQPCLNDQIRRPSQQLWMRKTLTIVAAVRQRERCYLFWMPSIFSCDVSSNLKNDLLQPSQASGTLSGALNRRHQQCFFFLRAQVSQIFASFARFDDLVHVINLQISSFSLCSSSLLSFLSL